MAAPEAGFVVDGLTELIRDLRAVDRNLARSVTKGFKDAMSAQLKPTAQRNIGGQPVPKSAAMISAFGTQSEAGLKLHYSRFPWAAGAEFGSRRFRQFRPWVGNQWTGAGQFPGYMIGPAFRAHLDTLDRTIEEAVRDALMRGGFGGIF